VYNITIVGKIKKCGDLLLLVVTTMSSQFEVDSISLPMFSHCDYFGAGPHRSLPHAKLSGTNLKIGTCGANFVV